MGHSIDRFLSTSITFFFGWVRQGQHNEISPRSSAPAPILFIVYRDWTLLSPDWLGLQLFSYFAFYSFSENPEGPSRKVFASYLVFVSLASSPLPLLNVPNFDLLSADNRGKE